MYKSPKTIRYNILLCNNVSPEFVIYWIYYKGLVQLIGSQPVICPRGPKVNSHVVFQS